MIVCKFGGTSVGSGERFAATADRVVERRGRGCLVVVSAMAQVTRELHRLGELAGAGRSDEIAGVVDGLRSRHLQAIDEAGITPGEASRLTPAIEAELGGAEDLAAGAAAAGRLTDPARDALLATGELLSSRILAAVLRTRGVDCEWIDPRDLVATDDRFGRARPDEPEIERRVGERVRPALAAGRVVVTGGFVGRAPGGETTILGWEASDYSATLLGAALPADLVEIFSDVDGVYTTDPRVVPAARLIPRMSYAEATDLAFFGAKVLHPSTMAPVARKGVPVRIRNSFRPEHEGTLVSAAIEDRSGAGARGVAARGGLAPADLAALVAGACGASLLDRLTTAGEGAAEEPAPAVAPGMPTLGELEGLSREDGEPERGLALVALVGDPWRPGVAARSEAALAGIPFAAVPRNGCGTHRCFVVPDGRRPEALRLLERVLVAEETT